MGQYRVSAMTTATPPPHSRPALPDPQDNEPTHAIALHEAGIIGARARLLLADGASETGQAVTAHVDLTVSLDAAARGAHMSRFHHAIAELDVAELGATQVHPAQAALTLAVRAAERQVAQRATCVLTATLLMEDAAPLTGHACQLPVELRAGASIDLARGTVRTLLEITVAGMNACPCAQELLEHGSRERLAAEGFTAAQVDRIIQLMPLATHNQRGYATLTIGSDEIAAPAHGASVSELVDAARTAMGARIHEVLKRQDEAHVVAAAHAHPQFVEDCARGMLAAMRDAEWVPDAATVWATQVNQESIHAHDVRASGAARVSDLRGGERMSLRDGQGAAILAPLAWLDA